MPSQMLSRWALCEGMGGSIKIFQIPPKKQRPGRSSKYNRKHQFFYAGCSHIKKWSKKANQPDAVVYARNPRMLEAGTGGLQVSLKTAQAA